MNPSRRLQQIAWLAALWLTLLSGVGQATSAQDQKWLENYADTVVLLNQINAGHVHSLKQCACYLQSLTHQKLNSSCGAVSKAEPGFVRTAIGFYGNTLRDRFSCETILDAFVFKKLENNWSDLRQTMALMQPKQMRLDSGDELLTETFVNGIGEDSEPIPHLDYKINRTPFHDIQELPWSEHVLKSAMPPLNPDEIRQAVTTYRQFGTETCRRLMKIRGHQLIANLTLSRRGKYQGAMDEQICSLLIDHEGAWDVRTDLSPLIREMRFARAQKLNAENKKHYAELIQSNPLLVMVSGPHPSWNELIRALAYIDQNAQHRLEKSVKARSQPSKLLPFANQLFAKDSASVRWSAKGFSDEEFQHLGEPIFKAASRIEMRNSLIEMGAIVGLATACALPWGKGLSLGLQVLKFGCVVGTGIPLNTYFLIDSFHSYREGLESLFSSIEPDQALSHSLDQVKDARRGMILSALFMPVGMQLAESRESMSMLKTALKKEFSPPWRSMNEK